MPLIKRRFRKFDEDDTENAPPVTTTKNAAPQRRSFRNPFFQPLTTPSEDPHKSRFSESIEITNDASPSDNDEWPDVRQTNETMTHNFFQEAHAKQSINTKIPQLKGNRLDDILHNRAKEILLELRKERKVDPFVSKAEFDFQSSFEATTSRTQQEAGTYEISGWNPFETPLGTTSQNDNHSEIPSGTSWETFGSMPISCDDCLSRIPTNTPPLAVFDGGKTSSEEDCSVHSLSRIDMPPTLHVKNILEPPTESSNDEGNGEGTPVLDFSSTPTHISRTDQKHFSPGLKIVKAPMEGETRSPIKGPTTKERKSILFERKELLGSAFLPTNTPKGESMKYTSQCLEKRANRQPQLTIEENVEDDELLLGSLSGDHSIFQNNSPVSEDNLETSIKNIGAQEIEVSKKKCSENNFPVDVRIMDRESSFQSVLERVKRKNSIHFKTKPSPTSHGSLLDTESDVSDPLSGLCNAFASSDLNPDDRVDVIINTASFNSGIVSTISYPLTMKVSDGIDAGPHEARGNDASTSRYPHKTKSRPLGASAEEIIMLNKFLSVAGPKLRSPDLSIDEREEIHNKAIEAGLPEFFVNKILDQTAGITRWEEQSCGTLLTSESTFESSRHQGSVYSSDSYTTRYTQDNESISYHSYSRHQQTPKEAAGMYGCLGNLNNSFWSEMERGLSGDDMMENISAALSESFDEVRKRGRQRKRKKQVRV